jgi:hypothetical protein
MAPGAQVPTTAPVIVAAEEHGALLLEAAQPPEALLLEVGVAHRQRLVDDEHVRVHMRDHREGEAHGHARGVGLHRLVDELADVGEGEDLGEPAPPSPPGRVPRTLAFRKTFCRPVYSGLKPEPSSSRAATRPCDHRPRRGSGVSVPQTSCSRVDLPEPLRPMMPMVSPRSTSKESCAQRPELVEVGPGPPPSRPSARSSGRGQPPQPRHDRPGFSRSVGVL